MRRIHRPKLASERWSGKDYANFWRQDKQQLKEAHDRAMARTLNEVRQGVQGECALCGWKGNLAEHLTCHDETA